jgi:arsenite methyltransferase
MTSDTRGIPVPLAPAVKRDCGCADGCCEDRAGTPDEKVATAYLSEDATAGDVRSVVREKYGQIAEHGSSGCGAGGCCGVTDTESVLGMIGYGDADAAQVPEGSNLGLGCGNPLAFADAKAGETVLDLGSGGGIDCFLAARAVGPTGRVIGVDMTPAMIDRARTNAKTHRFDNVEFRLGEIEHLPVADASIDLIISNCVINLSPEKPQAFREAFRVLKPGGRVLVSDLVLTKEIAPEMRRSIELLVGCVAGASLREDYLQLMREAGFRDVEIVNESSYTVGMDGMASDSPERAAFGAVSSVKVRAYKP